MEIEGYRIHAWGGELQMERVLSMMAQGRIKAIIDDVLPLEEANEALERLERGEVVGRLVLRHAEPA